MHELSLARSILDLIAQEAERHGIRRVTVIRLVVGPLSGVMAEALEFGLEVLGRETLAAGARVEIHRPPVQVSCPACGAEPELEDWEPLCPECGAPGLTILQGEELRVESFEGDEENGDQGSP